MAWVYPQSQHSAKPFGNCLIVRSPICSSSTHSPFVACSLAGPYQLGGVYVVDGMAQDRCYELSTSKALIHSHRTLKALHPVQSAKSTKVPPSQYYGGGPHGNPGCLWFPFSFFFFFFCFFPTSNLAKFGRAIPLTTSWEGRQIACTHSTHDLVTRSN